MSALTARLHQAFLAALDGAVLKHSAMDRKPLEVDLRAAEPLLLRIYMYTLVGGAGERSRREYKVVLRTPRQGVGQYGAFDYSGGRFTTIVGYTADLDVFVLWDATLHPRFRNAGNLQVRDVVVWTAAAVGVAEQVRRLTNGTREVVLACQPPDLARALEARIAATGGLGEGEWATFLS